jgi:hypothetical protein
VGQGGGGGQCPAPMTTQTETPIPAGPGTTADTDTDEADTDTDTDGAGADNDGVGADALRPGSRSVPGAVTDTSARPPGPSSPPGDRAANPAPWAPRIAATPSALTCCHPATAPR